jgi:cephalosporin hydroxylase/glycosyltransferase involved in cell wall biosynthesis
VDLSVVVVVYNMQREARRSLHSLSRSYQRDIDELEYEVIVVENGSAPDQRLGEGFVRSFGREFRYVDMGADATPSPTVALNRGIAEARGRVLALMIDGAHVVSPRVLKLGMTGLEAYPPAVVAAQQWYVGPGQQPDLVGAGYDQVQENGLFDAIDWPTDGYRLFEISHFTGDRDWFDGIWESNCLFVPRPLLEQVGGFDDSFSMPGGEYANLELFERLVGSPGVTLVSMLGEASFHQVHGGRTTNQGDRDARRSELVTYADRYRELRGRSHKVPVKPIHFVGALDPLGARRTRSRRVIAYRFARNRGEGGPDGVPVSPEPMAEELRTAFVEAYWRGLAWTQTRWLGVPIAIAPTDLLVLQELVTDVRPDWVVVTGTSDGRALFLASVCDLLGNGRVVCVGDEREDLPQHPRITYVRESPHEPVAFDRVRAITGADPHGLVVLAGGAVSAVIAEFNGYAPLVRPGSYVVLENTIVNGRPVWPAHGPGPGEAVRRILAINGDFMQDTSWEKHALTFNAGGFLRRVR